MDNRITFRMPPPIAPGTGQDSRSEMGRIDKTFKNTLNKAMAEIDGAQQKADSEIQKLAAGKVDNIHQAMIALEEANIALQFTTQVRNKVVEAYQEIMRMQV